MGLEAKGLVKSFWQRKVVDDVRALSFDTKFDGDILRAGQRDIYTFSLAQAKQVYFDSLTNNSNLTWTLTGPRGAVVSGRRFDQSDSGDALSLLDLAAGDYQLVVDLPGDATLSTYSFRLLDLSGPLVQTLTPGTPFQGQTLNPGNETEAAVQLRCNCGGELAVFLPGSVNRDSLVLASRLPQEE